MHLHAWGAWEQERVHVCVHGLPLSCLPGLGAHPGWHTLPARRELSPLCEGTLTPSLLVPSEEDETRS